MDTIESYFDAVGLMRGPYAPSKRAVFLALVGAAAVTYIQPKTMFLNGNPRPWATITKNPEESNIPPTNFPWFFVPIIGAFVGGVLI